VVNRNDGTDEFVLPPPVMDKQLKPTTIKLSELPLQFSDASPQRSERPHQSLIIVAIPLCNWSSKLDSVVNRHGLRGDAPCSTSLPKATHPDPQRTRLNHVYFNVI